MNNWTEIEPPEQQILFNNQGGHGYDAYYFNYLEPARIHFFHPILGKYCDLKTKGFAFDINYLQLLAPLFRSDATTITRRVTLIGNMRFFKTYQLSLKEEVRRIGDHKSISFNHQTKRNRSLLEYLKNALNLQ